MRQPITVHLKKIIKNPTNTQRVNLFTEVSVFTTTFTNIYIIYILSANLRTLYFINIYKQET